MTDSQNIRVTSSSLQLDRPAAADVKAYEGHRQDWCGRCRDKCTDVKPCWCCEYEWTCS